MNKLLFIFATLLLAQTGFGQSDAKMTIDLKGNRASKEITIDSNGIVHADTLDGTLRIIVPDTFSVVTQYSIQFNSDTTKFKLTFDDKETGPHILLTGSDVINKAVYLNFRKGQLVSIGKGSAARSVDPAKPVAMIHPYIKINHPSSKPKDPAVQKPVDTTTQIPLDLGDINMDGYDFLNPAACPGCPGIKPEDWCNDLKCNPEKIASLANQIFLTPCYDKKGNAVSANYAIIYDARRNGAYPTPLILKYKPKKGYESFTVIKEDDFIPHSREGIAIAVIRPADTVFTLTSAGISDTLSQSADFAKQFGNITPAAAGADAAAAGAATQVKPAEVKTPAEVEALVGNGSAADLVAKYDSTAPLAVKLLIIDRLSKRTLPFEGIKIPTISDTTIQLLSRKGNERASADLQKLMDDLMYSLKKLYAQQDKNQPEAKSADSLAIYRDSVKSLQKQLAQKMDQITLKAKFTGLYNSLALFNSRFASIDLKEKEYNETLACLKNQIWNILRVRANDTVALGASLRDLAAGVDKKYTDNFKKLIVKIQTEYDKAIHKTATVGVYYFPQYVRVPKTDSISITLKNQKGDRTINTTYAVNGGIKIDFSTGFFVNGISNISYTLGQHTFRYKVTADTILPNGTDSIMYGGHVKDTTGNLVHANRSKLNYSIGVLAHIYQRSAHDFNYGGVIGVMLDNNSKILFVAGGSVMFRAGKNRVALAGGLALGQQTRITAVNSQYTYDPKTQPEFKTYNSIYEVPRFYAGTNDLGTYTDWKISWFAGITYNITIN